MFIKKGSNGIGVDIVELSRFREARFISRLAELVLTPVEYSVFKVHPDRVTFFASRFALKEAVIKAYPAKLTYHDIEIYKEGLRPQVKIAGAKKGQKVFVSLSHSIDYVAGFAITY